VASQFLKHIAEQAAGLSSEMLRCLLVVNVALWKDMRRLVEGYLVVGKVVPTPFIIDVMVTRLGSKML